MLSVDPRGPYDFFLYRASFVFPLINNDFAFNLIFFFFYFNIELLLKYSEGTVNHLEMTAYCLNILNSLSMLFCFICEVRSLSADATLKHMLPGPGIHCQGFGWTSCSSGRLSVLSLMGSLFLLVRTPQ